MGFTLRSNRWIDRYILAVIYFAVAAASFNGFFYKWTLRDGQPRYSIEQVLDGTADRPFIYRQLLPYLANRIDSALPADFKSRLIAKASEPLESSGRLYTQVLSSTASDPLYLVRYHVVYYLDFLFLFGALFAMRRLCLNAGIDAASSSLAPIFFALFFPFIQTNGGFYYDLPELYFLMAATALALSRRFLWLLPLTVLATLNKESFLLFLPALFPLLRTRISIRKASLVLGMLIVISAILNALVHIHFKANPGGAAELNVLQNLRSYVSYKMLFRIEANYGLLTLRGYSVFSIALLTVVVARGWRYLSVPLRQHAVVATAINLPLFIALGVYGELRGLSFLFGTLLLLIASCISEWIRASSILPTSTVLADLDEEEALEIPA